MDTAIGRIEKEPESKESRSQKDGAALLRAGQMFGKDTCLLLQPPTGKQVPAQQQAQFRQGGKR